MRVMSTVSIAQTPTLASIDCLAFLLLWDYFLTFFDVLIMYRLYPSAYLCLYLNLYIFS